MYLWWVWGWQRCSQCPAGSAGLTEGYVIFFLLLCCLSSNPRSRLSLCLWILYTTKEDDFSLKSLFCIGIIWACVPGYSTRSMFTGVFKLICCIRWSDIGVLCSFKKAVSCLIECAPLLACILCEYNNGLVACSTPRLTLKGRSGKNLARIQTWFSYEYDVLIWCLRSHVAYSIKRGRILLHLGYF